MKEILTTGFGYIFLGAGLAMLTLIPMLLAFSNPEFTQTQLIIEYWEILLGGFVLVIISVIMLKDKLG